MHAGARASVVSVHTGTCTSCLRLHAFSLCMPGTLQGRKVFPPTRRCAERLPRMRARRRSRRNMPCSRVCSPMWNRLRNCECRARARARYAARRMRCPVADCACCRASIHSQCICVCMHACMWVYTEAHLVSDTRVHSAAHKLQRAMFRVRMHTSIYTFTQIHAHTFTHTHTHTHTPIHTHTHTHTHTHRHTAADELIPRLKQLAEEERNAGLSLAGQMVRQSAYASLIACARAKGPVCQIK